MLTNDVRSRRSASRTTRQESLDAINRGVEHTNLHADAADSSPAPSSQSSSQKRRRR